MPDTNMSSTITSDELRNVPVIPLRNLVIFPHTVRPFNVGRPASVAAVRASLQEDSLVFLALQRDPQEDLPGKKAIFTLGVVARITQFTSQRDNKIKVWGEGVQRATLVDYIDQGSMIRAVVRLVPDENDESLDANLSLELAKLFEAYEKIHHGLDLKAVAATLDEADGSHLADVIASHLPLEGGQKQVVLETLDVKERMKLVRQQLHNELEKHQLDKKIHEDVKAQMEKAQREYYLNEKIKAIKKELGQSPDQVNELEELKERIEKAGLNDEAREKAEKELNRLEMMPPVSAESTVSRNFLEWILNVPWNKKSKEKRDLNKAHEILDRDHYGLDKVKQRILEFLAVRSLSKNPKGTILCFVGPPGVGKTSLAKSIAEATGRNFVRLSLGGVRDEAELRGHRRTYIGAYPGQIIQMMRRAGTQNPIFLLDEIDKVGQDFRGDLSSVLLEILDPEQNKAFRDHYLDVDYDLSKVFFLCTANVTHTIPAPLLDRLEVINLSSYTHKEKVEILTRYLVPKQAKACGVEKVPYSFSPEGLDALVERYTREAGVRNLEREAGSLFRKVAHRKLTKKLKGDLVFDPDTLADFLGPPKYKPYTITEEPQVGLVHGLAVTAVGGTVLDIEVTTVKGSGKVQLTGKLGEVMQESGNAAITYVKSRAQALGLADDAFDNIDIHLHVPEGATPKDGPSAGIAMATVIASVFTNTPVKGDLAMTGEITLRGRVLPIGGVKEKVLAAYRAGIRHVLLPEENGKDIVDIPEDVRKLMNLTLVSHVDEVLTRALNRQILDTSNDLPENPPTKLQSDHTGHPPRGA